MEKSSQPGSVPTLTRALLALEKMEARLKAAENAQREPIAIIGLGCRFPGGATDAETFWRLLRDGVDTVTEVPADRWDIDVYYDSDPDAPGKMSTRRGAFLDQVDQFDPQFFGIMPKEAHAMDPQQRLLLETTWEALENAGIAPDTLSGSRTGVYVGILGTDYAAMQTTQEALEDISPYYGSGVAHSIASGRISYILGLQGPSLSIDTACSSSLVAIHQACLSLRSRETNLSLAGGVNLMLLPDATIALSKNRMMAPDGHCKTFDAAADGYVRGEGCGMLVLKRLADALADGDNILAVIRGTAVNQDGASGGLTVPNGPAQEAVIREALANAGINPLDVTYVETHGTGTSLGDPIEVQALTATLGKGRSASRPLLIGSIKTNFGHTETAAGVASVIKLILMLKHKAVPPHLHLKQPNPLIPWAQIPISVPTQLTPWAEDAPLVAGVSSFGFSGTNAHMLLTPAPVQVLEKAAQDVERPSHIFTLSAKTEPALQEMAARAADYLQSQPGLDLADAAFTANTGRAKFAHRVALWADSPDEAAAKLKAYAAGEETTGLITGRTLPAKRLRIAFLFTGQGAQYTGMSRELYQTQPVFRAALDECAALLEAYLPQPLLHVIFADSGSERAALLDQTLYTQTALFAVEYALSKLWQSWGVEPFAVMGHSLGEYVAACLAGVFSLQDAVKLVAERGRLMQSLPAGGKMRAVFADEARVRAALEPHRERVSIAAVNGYTNTVISGDGETVDAVCAALEAEGIKTRPLTVSHAFHSPLVEPILADFERAAASIQYQPPRLRVISNLTGEPVQGDMLASAAYWRDHIRQPVQFVRGVESLLSLNIDILVEIGPSPALLSMTGRITGADEKLSVPTLRQGRADWHQLLESLGKLFLAGVPVNWAGFDQPYARQRVELPAYPFQRQRYWIEQKARRRTVPLADSLHPLLGSKLASPLKTAQFEALLERESFTFTRDHLVRGTAIMPMTGYLEMAQAAARIHLGSGEYALLDGFIHQPLVLDEETTRSVHFLLTPEADGASFEVYSRAVQNPDEEWQLHASGRIQPIEAGNPPAAEPLAEIQARCSEQIAAQDHYAQLAGRGFPFGPAMQGVRRIWRRMGEALVEIAAPTEINAEIAEFHLHPALMDACLQSFWATFDPDDKNTYLPMSFERFELLRPLPETIWSHIHLRDANAGNGANAGNSAVTGDVLVMDAAGQVVARVEGLYFRPAAQHIFQERREWDDWLYEVEWQPLPKAEHLPVLEAAGYAVEDIAAQVDAQVVSLAEMHRIQPYRSMFPRLEALSADYIGAAVREMGWSFQPGQRVTVDTLMPALGIIDRYRRLTARLMDILSEVGVLQKDADGWVVQRMPGAGIQAADLQAASQDLLRRYPESLGQLTLVSQCGASLAVVLRGKVDPLSLLFPSGSLELTEQLYRESPQSRIYNSMVRDGIQKVLESLPADRPLRILEIGAGTGGTTSHVLPILPEDRTEYYFTDISPLFLSRARDRFAQFDFVRYELLNVENDPAGQGFAGQAFDIVLAVNVLHATADMTETLENVRKVMKPDGLLVLVEGTSPERWVDVTFGLTDGWWRYTDTALRANYPLMSRETWHSLLTATGFQNIQALPSDQSQFQQALILAQPAPAAPGQWLVFDDQDGLGQGIAERLAQRNQTCLLVRKGNSYTRAGGACTLDPSSADDFKRLIADVAQESTQPLRGVLYLWPLDMRVETGAALEPQQSVGLGGGVHLAQALASADIEPPRLWLLTREAQPVPQSACLSAGQSTLWGLGKVIQLEHPELRCTRVDLDGSSTLEDQIDAALAEIWQAGEEDQTALRGGERYAARLKRASLEALPAQPEPLDGSAVVRLHAAGNGVIEDLSWQPVEAPQPGPGQVAVEVRAAALNFRDLMNVLAMRSDDEALGGECSGVVTAVGAGVSDFQAGDAVMGMAGGSFSSRTVADTAFMVHKPASLSFAEAAAQPIAYFTAYTCLQSVAQIQPGQKVLIHAAAGGVGMAAVHIAQRARAQVFATAGSDAKRAYLKSLGVKHVYNSRTLDFAAQIMADTGGQGVDVVLNALSGEFIPSSVSVLAENGTFVEIGKRDIWTQAQFAQVKPSAKYHIVDLAQQVADEPQRMSPVFMEVMGLIRDGALPPLPVKSFSHRQAAQAFRYMAQSLHTGKVAVTMHGYRLRPDGAYLITGGLSGLGLLTARHLADCGARHLVLVARSAPSEAAEQAVAELEASGVRVAVMRADISEREEVRRVLRAVKQELPPLRGIIHAAGVLDDASLLRQEWSKFMRVLAPKVDGAWFLHSFTLDEPLDFFILYSSTSALMGSPGQSNHAAANTFMDSLAHHRRMRGLPALSINWGIWSQIGSAAARKADEWMLSQGVGTINPEQGRAMFDLLFAQDRAQIGVLPIDWATYLSQFKKPQPWLSAMVEEARVKGKRSPAAAKPQAQRPAAQVETLDFQQKLAQVPPNQQRQFLLEHIHAQVGKAIGLPSGMEIDPRQALNELGLDSLMAVELRNMLSSSLKLERSLSATLVFDYPTINALTDYLAQDILKLQPKPAEPKAAPAEAPDLLKGIEDLSDEEVARLLSDLE